MAAKNIRRRTPRMPLTRNRIVAAASAFTLEELSMPALASALDVTHPALYHHFPNKQALVDALAVEALAETALRDTEGMSPREVLVESATTLRDVIQKWWPHTPTSAISGSVQITKRIVETLVATGCAPERALDVAELVVSWCLYSASRRAWLSDLEDSSEEVLTKLWERTSVGEDSALRLWSRVTADDFEATFARVLEEVLDRA